MSLFRMIAAGVALAALAVAPATAQDFTLNPTFGVTTLATGFQPDPAQVQLQSGGAIDASALNNQQHAGDCRGMIASAPDYRVTYTAGTTLPLIISAHSTGDTTLVINGPNQEWYCNDDRVSGDHNPAVTIAHPPTGQYDIWVGTYGDTTLLPTTLSISEITAP